MYKSTDPTEQIPVGAEIIIDGERVRLIAPAAAGMHDADACPSWCAVDWHADLRMWEPSYGERPGLAGDRRCVSTERIVDVPDNDGMGHDPIRLWLERFQRFSFRELAQGYALHSADEAGVHVSPIGGHESHLPAATVVGMAAALTELHAVMARR